jgi:hypothetical protein
MAQQHTTHRLHRTCVRCQHSMHVAAESPTMATKHGRSVRGQLQNVDVCSQVIMHKAAEEVSRSVTANRHSTTTMQHISILRCLHRFLSLAYANLPQEFQRHQLSIQKERPMVPDNTAQIAAGEHCTQSRTPSSQYASNRSNNSQLILMHPASVSGQQLFASFQSQPFPALVPLV